MSMQSAVIRKPDGMACEVEKLLLPWLHDWMQQICMSKEPSTRSGKSIIIAFPILKNRLPETSKDCAVRESKEDFVFSRKRTLYNSVFWKREMVRISGVAMQTF